MFYLFNKIHLKLDVMYARSVDRIILTDVVRKQNIKEQDIGLFEAIVGKQVFIAETYNELISKQFNGIEEDFIRFLIQYDSQTRIEVHLGSKDIYNFLCRWYKTILPNLSSQEAYTFFRISYLRISNQYGQPFNAAVKLSDRDCDICRTFIESLPSKEVFEHKWKYTEVFNLTSEELTWIKSNTALEFQLATYLTTGNEVIKNALESRMKLMYLKTHIKELCDQRELLLQNLLVLPNFNAYADIKSWVIDNPDYLFLIDPYFKPDNLDYVFENYDTESLNRVTNFLMSKQLGLDSSEFISSSHFLDKQMTIEDILTFESTSPFHREFLGRWEYSNYINNYLLDTVLRLNRENNSDRLSQYSLIPS